MIHKRETDALFYVATIGSGEAGNVLVICEKALVLDNVASISEAIMYLFACYYVFNAQYFQKCFYEFIQRSFVGIGILDRKPLPRVSTLLRNLDLPENGVSVSAKYYF